MPNSLYVIFALFLAWGIIGGIIAARAFSIAAARRKAARMLAKQKVEEEAKAAAAAAQMQPVYVPPYLPSHTKSW